MRQPNTAADSYRTGLHSGREATPGDRWRSYVIERPSSIYNEFTGTEATGTRGGRFETLCRYTLAELGFTDEGLPEAILYPRNLG
jgi:hypothetical protein